MRKLLLVLGLWCMAQAAQAQVGLFIRPNSSSLSSPVSGQTWLFNSTNNTMNVWNGSIFQVASAPQNNFAATTNPTTADDNTVGYSPASLWYNTSNGNTYECVDATTSAAIWIQTNNLGGLSIPLTQLATGGASAGQSLIFNGTHWAPGAPAINLSQVLQSGATSGQVPIWNGSAWVAGTTSGAGAVDLSQLTQSSATTGDAIQWNGSNWVAVNPINYFNGPGNGNQVCLSDGANPSLGYGWVTNNAASIPVYNSSTTNVAASDPTFIYIDASGGDVNLTLPVTNLVGGKVYQFVIINFTNNVTINADSGGPDQIILYGNPTPVSSITLTSGVDTNYPIILACDGAELNGGTPPGNWIQLTPHP